MKYFFLWVKYDIMLNLVGAGIVLSGAVGGGVYLSVHLDHPLAKLSKRLRRIMNIEIHKPRTIIDVCTCQEAEHLVRTVDRGGGGDDIAERLFSIYSRFPPTERTMRSLAMLYETLKNKGGVDEYVVTLLYGVTTDVLCNTLVQKKPIPRPTSYYFLPSVSTKVPVET